MKTLIKKLEKILKEIPDKDFKQMIQYVEKHYKNEGHEVDKEMLIAFFENNFSTGIWYESLSNSLYKKQYNAILRLGKSNWENADKIGSYIGNYVVEKILNENDSNKQLGIKVDGVLIKENGETLTYKEFIDMIEANGLLYTGQNVWVDENMCLVDGIYDQVMEKAK